jgi:hypothetical protein
MRRRGVSHSFYLAREGRLLLDAYERVADLLPDSPRRHYAHLSRQAVSGALLDNLQKDARGLPGKIGHDKVGSLLDQYPLDDALLADILRCARLDKDATLTPGAREKIAEACSTLVERLDEERAVNQCQLANYLRQLAGQEPIGAMALIDSGWAGTTQLAVARSLGEESDITGLYLGVSAQGPAPTARSRKFGLLRNDHSDVAPGVALFKSAGIIRAWELILADQEEPTTVGLRTTDTGAIEPILEGAKPLDAALRQARDELTQGILEGVEALRPAVAALVALDHRIGEDVVMSAARVFARRAFCYPERDIAKRLLEFSFHEGVAASTWSSLDLAGLRRGVAWLPAILAKYRLSSLQLPLEVAASVVDRLRS